MEKAKESIALVKACIKKDQSLVPILSEKETVKQNEWKKHDEFQKSLVGNKALAVLIVDILIGELQRQIKSWLAQKFEFLLLLEMIWFEVCIVIKGARRLRAPVWRLVWVEARRFW